LEFGVWTLTFSAIPHGLLPHPSPQNHSILPNEKGSWYFSLPFSFNLFV
jgi:hypothetical protein